MMHTRLKWLTWLLVLIAIQLITCQVIGQHTVYSILADTVQSTYIPAKRANQIIKAGIGLPLLRRSSVSPTFIDVAVDMTVEQRLNKNISVVGGLESHYLFSRYAQLYSLELPIGLRYYFSIGKKMKKRTETNNFFRHYVAFQTYNVLFADLVYDLPNPSVQTYYRGQHVDHITNGGKYQEAFNLVQNAYFQLGTQIRLPRTNYLDVNVGIPISALIYTKRELTLATPALINIKYGIVWLK